MGCCLVANGRADDRHGNEVGSGLAIIPRPVQVFAKLLYWVVMEANRSQTLPTMRCSARKKISGTEHFRLAALQHKANGCPSGAYGDQPEATWPLIQISALHPRPAAPGGALGSRGRWSAPGTGAHHHGRVRFAELFGHIRTIHRKQKMSETLITEFRKHVPTAKQPAQFVDEELIPFGEAFHAITDASFKTFQHADTINAALRHLARIDNFDWQPLAIQVFARHGTDPAYLLRFVNALERFAYGLFLTRADTNARMRRYGATPEAFQRGADLHAADSPLQMRSDDKAGVRQALAGDIYTETRIRLPLLLRLDSMLAAGGATYDHATISVEHVLPQTVASGQWAADFPNPFQREAWVHKLANLLLLTRRKNAQANNASFAAKKMKYFSSRGGTSNFALTNQVLAEPVWTLDVLQRRQASLIAKIAQVWEL